MRSRLTQSSEVYLRARFSELVDEIERPGSWNRMSRFGEICQHSGFPQSIRSAEGD
jgi:hypothetical protein